MTRIDSESLPLCQGIASAEASASIWHGTFTVCLVIAFVATVSCHSQHRDQLSHNEPPEGHDVTKSMSTSSENEPHLVLRWVGKPDELIVRLTMKNGGPKEILVDRELVVGFEVEAETDKGVSKLRVVSNARVEDGERRSVEKRFVRLKSGASVSRDINLKTGFVVFVAAVSSDEQSRPVLVTGMESLYKWDAEIRPARIRVSYSLLSTTDAGIAKFFRRTAGEIGMYSGEMDVEIRAAPN